MASWELVPPTPTESPGYSIFCIIFSIKWQQLTIVAYVMCRLINKFRRWENCMSYLHSWLWLSNMQVRPLKLPCWARLVGTQDVVSIPVSHTFMCMHICECTFSKIASILGMAQLTWWRSSRLSDGRIVEFDTLSMWADLVYLYSLLLLSLVTLDVAVDIMFRFVFVRSWLIMPRMLWNRRGDSSRTTMTCRQVFQFTNYCYVLHCIFWWSGLIT